LEITDYISENPLSKNEVRVTPHILPSVNQQKFPKPKRKIADPKVLEFQDNEAVDEHPL
jgi:hypothetical protein